MTLQTLKITRPLLNTDELGAWAADNGLGPLGRSPHVTLAYSRAPLDWTQVGGQLSDTLVVYPSEDRAVETLAGGAVALLFADPTLMERHAEIRMAGASWDWPNYRPHVTITYDGTGLDLTAVAPYMGPLIFGLKRFAEIEI